MNSRILCYKLTTQENTTRNGTLWGAGVTHKTSGEGELCSSGWLHAYTSPLLAVLLNPIHGDFRNPKLWEAYGCGKKKDDNGLKVGFSELTTSEEIPLPEISVEQKVAFGILCALHVYPHEAFKQWAEDWLSGKGRSAMAAWSAASAAKSAAWSAAWSAESAAKSTLPLQTLAQKAASSTSIWSV